jgi:hypothetical protein|tara:strand:+ start:664 stop:1077 length:414 start_codon:yes stop_codon:yes gene_type:complete
MENMKNQPSPPLESFGELKQVRILYHDDPEPKKMAGREDWKSYYNGHHSDPDILDAVWEQWNAGSGNEGQQFLKLGVRSMMVGDYVCIDGKWHECLTIGWRINVPWEEVMGDVPKKDFSDISKETVEKALTKQLLNN